MGISKLLDSSRTRQNFGTNYSLSDYADMISDSRRVQPYLKALKAAVKPGCTVLDLGAGTGFFSIMACRFGAGQVIAIEPNPANRIGREIANANGFGDQIHWIENFSTEIELDNLADLMISDLRGSLPLFGFHLPSVLDARRRLLAPDAIMIPASDHLFIAPVEVPSLYNRLCSSWAEKQYQLDLSASLRFQLNKMHKTRFRVEQLAGKPRCWLTLDYAEIEHASAVGTANWLCNSARTVHGFALWFEADLGFSQGFTNSPEQPRLIYSQSFLPLTSPIDLEIGDRLNVQIDARWLNDSYVWRWKGALEQAGSKLIVFDQSTLAGKLFPTGWNTDRQ